MFLPSSICPEIAMKRKETKAIERGKKERARRKIEQRGRT
jgi:hypothetical protein